MAVVGGPDAEWGKRVHAVVQPRLGVAPPTGAELDRQEDEDDPIELAPGEVVVR